MWYLPASRPTFDLLPEQVGNTQSHTSVRVQEVKTRRMVITPMAGGKVAAAIEQPVAETGLTISKKI